MLNKSPPLFAALILGLFYLWLHEFGGRIESKPFIFGLTIFLSAFVLLITFAWHWPQWRRQLAGASILAIILALPAVWVAFQVPNGDVPFRGDQHRLPTYLMAFFLAGHIVLPFYQLYVQRLPVNYHALFNFSWNNTFTSLLTMVFTGVVALLLQIWGLLFKTIDIAFFARFFNEPEFIVTFYPVVAAVGITVISGHDGVLNAFKNIFLALTKVLLPLLAVILFLFLLSLPFTGLQALWATHNASNILLTMTVLILLFFNAMYQDGEAKTAKWQRLLSMATVIVMPVLCILIFVSIGKRTAQYGLTPERFFVWLVSVVLFVYALAYLAAIAARTAKPLAWIQPVNITMAVIVALLALVVHTPLLDPLAWSARDQYQRLVSGETAADQFDYGYLLFRLGWAGHEQGEKLLELKHHPDYQVIVKNMKQTKEQGRYARQNIETALTPENLDNFTHYDTIPAALLKTMNASISQYMKALCGTKKCVIYSANMDNDPFMEVLFYNRQYTLDVFDSKNNGQSWFKAAQADFLHKIDGRQLYEAMKNRQLEPVEKTYKDLQLGKHRLFMRMLTFD